MIRIRKTHPLIKIANNALVDLPAPINISAWWNFGSLLGLCLVTQILTGLFLAIHYSGDVTLAFNRVAHITRDVNYGWLLRVIHANGASFFFYLLVFTRRARYILLIVYVCVHLNGGGNHFIFSYGRSFYRICINLRANIILGRHSYHQPFIGYPLFRANISTMNLRGICGR